MTFPGGDAPPVKPPPSFSPTAPVVSSAARPPGKRDSTSTSDTVQASTRIGPSPPRPLSVSNTSELPIRSSSPSSRLLRSTPQLARSSTGIGLDGRLDGPEDIRSLIIRSFSPTVAVYASDDTDDLVRKKGFKGGFWELIRPFGETVSGKIVVRDSTGSARGWEDFGVRFVKLAAAQDRGPNISSSGQHDSALSQMEQVLWRQLSSPGDASSPTPHTTDVAAGGLSIAFTASPLYKSFLRQLLSAPSPTPHETFGHPVACVIAISSRNTSPLESLRQLYADTNTGSKRPVEWVHPEFLRYYVLVHDEDVDDIGKSTMLYDQMKRHFGLHCHLLRLRSNQCVVTDEDSVQAPKCEWLSPSEHMSSMGEAGML